MKSPGVGGRSPPEGPDPPGGRPLPYPIFTLAREPLATWVYTSHRFARVCSAHSAGTGRTGVAGTLLTFVALPPHQLVDALNVEIGPARRGDFVYRRPGSGDPQGIGEAREVVDVGSKAVVGGIAVRDVHSRSPSSALRGERHGHCDHSLANRASHWLPRTLL